MTESDKIRRLRDQVSLLRTAAERAHLLYRQSIIELDHELAEQPPAIKGFHFEEMHVWRRAERNPVLPRLETCSCGASRTVQL